MIVGVTGLIGSGKGAVSDLLIGRGFEKIGHSDIIAEEMKEKGMEINRKNLVSYANEMRKKYGNNYFSKKIVSRIKHNKDYVVEGFRNLAEIEEFKKMEDFVLVGVSAGFKRRFNWILQRSRPGDPKTLEEFKQTEKVDFLQPEAHGQQNALCFSMADYYISNEGTYEDLQHSVEELLAKYDFG